MTWDWFISEEGQAVATWLSAALSVLALGIALAVAIVERRHAHAELLREARRDQEAAAERLAESLARKNRFIDLCIEIADEAIAILTREIANLQPQIETYISWRRNQDIPQMLKPLRSSLAALQSVWQDDAKLVLTLSRTVRTLDELIDPVTFDSAPLARTAIAYAQEHLDDLSYRRDAFAQCKSI